MLTGSVKPVRAVSPLLAIVLVCFAAHAAALEPAKQIIAPFDGAEPGRGASVSGGGEWAIVADGPPVCDLRVYRRNWRTMGWGSGIDGIDAGSVNNPNANYDIVTNNSQATCDDGNFGVSSSLSGDMLVVGVNEWDSIGGFCPPADARDTTDAGGILVYVWSGNDSDRWERRRSGNCVNSGEVIVAGNPQDLSQGDDRQAGARFGSSVSVARVSGNFYLIAVGEPGYDAPGETDNGRISIYEYVAIAGALGNDAITRVGTVVGNNGDRLGTAVTTNAIDVNQQYVLAGAPGAGSGGAVRLYAITFSTVTLAREILGDPGNGLGREVSLSNRYLLAAGEQTAVSFVNAANDGSPGNYVELPEIITFGGDVSQSSGVVAYGFSSFGGFAGATLLRDRANDDQNNDRIDANVNADVGGELSDIGADIRLVDESLWFANEARAASTPANRAILYQYPAGYGGRNDLPFGYYLRSLSCDVSGKTVGELFGHLGIAAADDPVNATYDIYLYDENNVTSNRPYIQAGASDVVDQRFAVWIATNADPDKRYVAIGDCNGFTVPDRVAGAAGPDGTLIGPAPLDDGVRTQKIVALPDAADPGNGEADFARVMVNNPYPRPLPLSEVRYLSPSGTESTLAQAEAGGFLSQTVYLWEPENSAYRAVSSSTPGFSGEIDAYEAFWVLVLENGQGGVGPETHALVVPQMD